MNTERPNITLSLRESLNYTQYYYPDSMLENNIINNMN